MESESTLEAAAVAISAHLPVFGGGLGGLAEDVHVLQTDGCRDAARGPVLDALNPAFRRVECEHAGDLGRATKGFDECCVGVLLGHGAITHHV